MKVADMHCDTIAEIYYALRDGREGGSLGKNLLHVDLEKMEKGDYLLQNFAMFVHTRKHEDPFAYCLKLIDVFYHELEANQNKIALALNYEDIMKNQKAGKISAFLTIEDGAVTKGSLVNLRTLYRLGVRLITLTWNHENGIGYPNYILEQGKVPDQNFVDTVNGLTDFGIEFVTEMERLGMIIDVSHLSDAGFYQVLHNTKKPFTASHSNARAKCNHNRNLTDDMIRHIANRGGLIGVNYNPPFLDLLDIGKKDAGTISAIVDNIEYIASVGGYECVGLGSDFDGIKGHKELPDASALPLLEDVMRKRGMKQQEIEAVFYKNVLRLYKDVL
ncbi:MAG: peptidase [Anaerocolumna sp.]|jgi:membrane dipeptidase|nr:peptidase [Anaerocolumna sp.]